MHQSHLKDYKNQSKSDWEAYFESDIVMSRADATGCNNDVVLLTHAPDLKC